MAKRDYYDVLGVGRDATDEQIRAAYRKLARKYHPDVNKAGDASDKFKEATEAYEVLSSPEKRKLFDQFGHAGMRAGAAPGGGGWPGYSRDTGFSVNMEDLFGGPGGGHGFLRMSLDEILKALRGGRGRPGRSGARKGGDLEHRVTLDFMQAAGGTTVTLRFQPEGGAKAETIDVKIPAGVREGSKVRVKGKGSPGPGGRGDLYIVTHVRPHPYFRSEGRDIYVDVPISIVEAALGAKVDVPTIDGLTTMTIPPGVSSSQRLRLRGKGIAAADGRGRGDQYVVVKIVAPREVSARGSEILRQFESVEKPNPRGDVPWT